MLKLALPMIKTEADLAKLTHRQREVLTAVARQLSNNEVARLSHIAAATTNIDAEALLQAYATIQEVFSSLESSTAQSVSPALAPLAREWSALIANEKTTTQEHGESLDDAGAALARP